ncbi:MAG: FAD-binding protein [Lachnospiraceae bacterium]|nr:FAD-binding protein [Lachnospiraceae bacterium]
MSRLTLIKENQSQVTVESLSKDLERRIVANPTGACPVDMTSSFIKMCLAQSCGKCVPCRVGLNQLARLFDDVLNNKADEKTLTLIQSTAESIYLSADCAVGYGAAEIALKCLEGCRDDFLTHIREGHCSCNSNEPVSCVNMCPAHVDIPGYIALVHEERYADAIRLIRKDNPLPSVCAYVCEHPCENHCKRNLVDAAINIRGIKKMAADHAGEVPVPKCAASTGKKVAVIGGGPGGLSAAYFLSLMGHKVTIYEQRKKLGGMLRYGIPNYRLPRTMLDSEIKQILSTGIEVQTEVSIGKDVSMDEIVKQYDACFVAIGAHIDKKLGIEGEDAKNGVISAVSMLRGIGDDIYPDFKGKEIVVVGGGNVAMDVARTSIRLGASKVSIVYRRRKADMTALREEIESAEAEGCDILELMAPVKVEVDADGNAVGLWMQPQMISNVVNGRPAPKKANKEMILLHSDVIIVAIGQGITTEYFEETGIPVKRGTFAAQDTGKITTSEGIFAGGDCVTGPATVIRAIAAGKVAAANIDEYLGFHHVITTDIDIPRATHDDKLPCGRAEVPMRDAFDRKDDFDPVEKGYSCEEACHESGRCLRCDNFGFGSFRGGRQSRW